MPQGYESIKELLLAKGAGCWPAPGPVYSRLQDPAQHAKRIASPGQATNISPLSVSTSAWNPSLHSAALTIHCGPHDRHACLLTQQC